MNRAQVVDQERDRKDILKAYRNLLKSFKYRLSKTDKQHIRHAFKLAMEAHYNMRRKSGEPYILHPLAVATIVAEEIGLGVTSVVCALLHDVVEDSEITLEDIEREFNKDIAKVVDGLTKISGIVDITSSQQAENFRKLLLTLADDVRVILIKIADRLHNMRTLDSMTNDKQLKIASETSYLYAPLAHRLGLYAIKTEMEDLALKYSEPEMYRDIARKLNTTKRERTRYINEFIKPVSDKIAEMYPQLKVRIVGRPKSIFSIYNKMKKKGVAFEEVFDLFAIRIIVDVPPDQEKQACWNVYSAISDIYYPKSERLRDWINAPKSNGYESLHTTVMGPKGRWVEVQIRSERMDLVAERGFAAHWKYKEDRENAKAQLALDEWLESIREILKNPDSNALDFINDFKMNLFSDEIYVFTPTGELRMLPKKSTALDFAFEIHTDIGHHCIGAKVNHKLVPLSYELRNGDQVEIITSRKQKPNDDWYTMVVTAKAKSRIRQALNDEKRRISLEGREQFERKLKQLKIPSTAANVSSIIQYYKAASPVDFYFDYARKKISLAELKGMAVVNGKLRFPKKEDAAPGFEETIKQTLQKNAELLIMGDSKIDYKLASCCNPIPGDAVFGFITINDGIKIHRINCPNAAQLMAKYHYRVLKTKWTKERAIAFLTGLKVSGIDDIGVMQKITNIISVDMNVNMRSITIDSQEGIFEGTIMLYVNDTEQLEKLIERLRQLDGILTVTRIEDTQEVTNL
jgi:GTP pyrophosphokinase